MSVMNVLKEPTKQQQAKLDASVVQPTPQLSSLEQEVTEDVTVSNVATVLIHVTYKYFYSPM